MPGRLRSSFRFGNLAEHLGLLLLKGIAAVAEVSRPEDVGLDAVASLLRRDQDGNCYAEDSFSVQLKSESEASIEYRDHELNWLLRQMLPMFIGRVSLQHARISLCPTLYINQAALAMHAEQVIVRFGTSGIPPFLAGADWSPWAGGAEKTVTVWLGEPLLEWSIGDLGQQAWQLSAYGTLKRFLGVVRREYELLSFGQCSAVAWSTNNKESIRSTFAFAKGHPDNFQNIVQNCIPGLRGLMEHSLTMPEERRNSVMVPLLNLVAALRDQGVDIDPENIFAKLFVAFRRAPLPEQSSPSTPT
jgi:hypothetical protein